MTDDDLTIEQANSYHRRLPLRIRDYLNRRGILDYQIELHTLGWNGSRITIPIRGKDGEITQFRLARDPEALESNPKMLSTKGSSAELYGWEWLHAKPQRVIVCEGEFDRLVLQRHGFPAVTSTGGAGVFKRDWARRLGEIPEVYVCFDRDQAGHNGGSKVAKMIPGARTVVLPEEVGKGGDVTDFFVELGKRAADFEALLEDAPHALEPARGDTKDAGEKAPDSSDDDRAEVERLKASVRLEDVVHRFIPIRRRGRTFRTKCPFHDDQNPSFVVFPDTQTFHCFGCLESGDVITFLQKMQDLTFPEALDVLRELDKES